MQEKKILFLVNPNAGRGVLEGQWQQVQQVLESEGAQVLQVQAHTVPEAVEQGKKSGFAPELLVCCGGDGTLSAVADYMVKEQVQIPVGYIPAGSTNDFAATLGLSKDPVEAARQILAGEDHWIDLGDMADRNFVYVASFGAFSQASYATDRNMKKALGHMAYVLEGIRELPGIKPIFVDGSYEGGSFRGEYVMGAVCNTLHVGGMMKLPTDQVNLQDGLFEILLVRMPQNLVELHEVLRDLSQGSFDSELIRLFHCKEASFRFQEPMDWSLDGELLEGGKEVSFFVRPKRLCLRY